MGASIAFIEIRDSTAAQDFIVPTGISMFRWRRSKTSSADPRREDKRDLPSRGKRSAAVFPRARRNRM